MIPLVSAHHFFTRISINSLFSYGLILVIWCVFSDSQLTKPTSHLGQKSMFLLRIWAVSVVLCAIFEITVVHYLILVLIWRWAWTAFLFDYVPRIKLLWLFHRWFLSIRSLCATWARCIGAHWVRRQGLILWRLLGRLAQLIRRGELVHHGFAGCASMVSELIILVFTIRIRWHFITLTWI